MVEDIPDPEDSKFFDEEFSKLVGSKKVLSFSKFMSWSDVQDILDENVLTAEEITSIWTSAVGGLNESADRRVFGIINNKLDDLIEEKESSSSSSSSSEAAVELTAEDVWEKTFNPDSVFDKGM
jgi:hypothetical protein